MTGEDPSESCFSLPEMAGETVGDTKTLGSAVAKVGGRQNPTHPGLNAETPSTPPVHEAPDRPAIDEQLYLMAAAAFLSGYKSNIFSVLLQQQLWKGKGNTQK